MPSKKPRRGLQACSQSLELTLSEAVVSISVLAPDLARVLVVPHGHVAPASWAVEKAEWPPVPVSIVDSEVASLAAEVPAGRGWRIITPELEIDVRPEPLRIVFSDRQGRVILADTDPGYRREAGAWECCKEMPEGDHCYGFGQKLGPLDKRGRSLEMWATDDPLHTPDKDPLYQAIPFFIGLREGRAYGIFLDSPAAARFDMGRANPKAFSLRTEAPVLDYYFFYGPHPKKVIERYTELTGRMPLPPLWALGYHQSRWSYFPADEVRRIAAEFRRRDIPCDAIHLDIDYMDGYRVFSWDPDRFPDPGALVEDLRRDGLKLVTIVDPGVKAEPSYPPFQEGLSEGHFCRTPDGDPYIGKVWPGEAAFPDFTQEATRRWWGELLQETLLKHGVAGIWNDMNEPSDFSTDTKTLPADVLQGEPGAPVPHSRVHNVYGLLMSRTTREGALRARPNQRPFVLTRSGYAGIQRYAAVWMGDNHSWWEHLLAAMPLCLGMGISGVPLVGTDIGGFGGDCDDELLARWTQMGALMPFCRNHSAWNTIPQEPWARGPRVEAVCREYIRLRYRLLPFLYNLFVEAHRTGLPAMRPLFLEYPQDAATYHLADQFLLGRDLLVAPVYQPGATHRLVYLPAGTWIDYWTGSCLPGPRWLAAEAPLERLPIYVRGGAIIPLHPVRSHVGPQPPGELILELYPHAEDGRADDAGAATSHLDFYEDDGHSNDYLRGICSVTHVRAVYHPRGLQIEVGDPEGSYRSPRQLVVLRLRAFPSPPREVQVHGQSHPWRVEPDGTAIIHVETAGARGFRCEVNLTPPRSPRSAR